MEQGEGGSERRRARGASAIAQAREGSVDQGILYAVILSPQLPQKMVV